MELIQHIGVLALTLGVLIAFHEYGHFIVARLCGVKVLEFSIGFGPKLFSFHDKHGTRFSLAALPLGGFVKMLDEREAEVAAELKHLAFNQQSVYARTAIVSAGPLANFLLAILVYWLVFLPGSTQLKAEIFSVEPASIAANAGLQTGDIIRQVDQQPVANAREVMMQLMQRLGDSGKIELVNQYGETFSLRIENWLSDAEGQVDIASSLGFQFYQIEVMPIVADVLPASPAAEAGLRKADRLLQVDDVEIQQGRQWIDYVRAHPEQVLTVLLERDGAPLMVQLTPQGKRQQGELIGQVGIAMQTSKVPDALLQRVEYTALSAWIPAVSATWQAAKFSLASVKKMILGQISFKQLSGPITIAKVATESAQSGIYPYLSLIALLSVSLGVLNLLPIPVLDGGHIFFYLIEWMKGSPVPDQVQEFALRIGMAIILSVMVLAFVNDIARL
ncbi:MAG: RIP metalloprotease RseP [Pseudomonadales bacterium]|nr:RIP metalloprotease RseP [Pseudomonadales bacterium]